MKVKLPSVGLLESRQKGGTPKGIIVLELSLLISCAGGLNR